MRRASEIETFLEQIFRPTAVFGARVLTPLAARFRILPWPQMTIWRRYCRWLLADEVSNARGLSQRASYQRIVISAQVGIGLVAAIIVLIGYLQQPEMVSLMTQQPVTLWNLRVPDKSKAVAESYPGARHNIPRDERRNGFLGFVNLSPQETNHVPVPQAPALSDIYRTEPDTTFLADQPVSYSPFDGELDTVIIPANAVYLDSQFEPALALINQPPYIVNKEDPAFPEIYRMDTLIEGFVSFTVSIDDHGKMARFVPVLPEGKALDTVWYFVQAEFIRGGRASRDGTRTFGEWKIAHDTYFARNIEKVIRNWVFGPALKDSRPVSGDLTLAYYFCLEYPDCAELTLDAMIGEFATTLKQVPRGDRGK